MTEERSSEVPGNVPPPFPGASGRGVRIAVIDSGVNPRHAHIGKVVGGIAIAMDGQIQDAGDDIYLDRLGHGTAVMAAIQDKAPEAEYFAVKVFHEGLKTTSSALVHAIGWCIDQRMDVVNLSLGSVNAAHADAFTEIAAEAVQSGILLVAAREANGQSCYPGCLPTVLSVGLDWDCPRTSYRPEARGEEVVFFASGYPRPVPGVPPTRNLYGISFAVANMSSFIVRACEGQDFLPETRFNAMKERLMRGVG
jgi:subtilisin family serine protease